MPMHQKKKKWDPIRIQVPERVRKEERHENHNGIYKHICKAIQIPLRG